MSNLRPLAAGLVMLLAACASGPPTPEWQLDAKSAIDRAVAQYLAGDTRASSAELDRARSDVGRTGRIDLVARVELMHCAARVASLVFEPCAGFERLRADAAPAERAYADYLAGNVLPGALGLLPPAQRAVAAPATGDAARALAGIDDPLSRLVGAGVLFQADRATPAVLALAVETASAQGWRRPLLAWLNVQRLRAEKAGDSTAVGRLQRQIEIVEQSTAPSR